eukprot:3936678-Rhodomonas_salina.3
MSAPRIAQRPHMPMTPCTVCQNRASHTRYVRTAHPQHGEAGRYQSESNGMSDSTHMSPTTREPGSKTNDVSSAHRSNMQNKMKKQHSIREKQAGSMSVPDG